MHSKELTSGTTVHYNGDFSGQVHFDASDSEHSTTLDFDDIEEFYLHHLRRELVSHVESMDTSELKDFFFGPII